MHVVHTSSGTNNFCWSFRWRFHLHILFLSEVMTVSLHWSLEILLRKFQYKIWHHEPSVCLQLWLIVEVTTFVVTFVWNKILKWNFHQHNQDVMHIHYHCTSSPKLHIYGFQQHYKANSIAFWALSVDVGLYIDNCNCHDIFKMTNI